MSDDHSRYEDDLDEPWQLDLDQRQAYFYVALFALFIMCVILIFNGINDVRSEVQESRRGIRCVLHELADHRHNTYEADKVQTEAAGAVLEQLPPTTLPSNHYWEDACVGFLPYDE